MNLSFLNFLTSGAAGLSSAASSLGLSTSSGSQIGNTFIQTIETAGLWVALIAGVGVFVVIGLGFMLSKRDDKRAEYMKWVPMAVIGLVIVAFAGGIVSWIASIIK